MAWIHSKARLTSAVMIVRAAAGDFVGVQPQLDIESLLGPSQQEKAKQNQRRGKNRGEIKSAAHSHADRGHHEQSGRRSDAGNQVAAIVQNGTSPDEADAGNDLRGDARVVTEELDRQRIREQG